MATNEYGIKEWARISGLSEVYIRRMVLDGTLPSHKVQISENVFKNMITTEDFEEFRKTRNHSKRADGRSRYLLFVSKEELEQVQQLLKDNEIGAIVEKQPQYKKVAK